MNRLKNLAVFKTKAIFVIILLLAFHLEAKQPQKINIYLRENGSSISHYPNEDFTFEMVNGDYLSVAGTGEVITYYVYAQKYNHHKKYYCQIINRNPDRKSAYQFTYETMIFKALDWSDYHSNSIGMFPDIRPKKAIDGFYAGQIYIPCWLKKPADKFQVPSSPPQYVGAMFYKIQEGSPPKDADQTAGLYWTTASVLNVRTKPTTKSKVAFALPFGTKIFVKEKTNVMFTYEGKTAAWWKIMTPYEEEGYVFSGFLTAKYEDLPPLHPDVGKWVEVKFDDWIYSAIARRRMAPQRLQRSKQGQKFRIIAVGPAKIMDDYGPYHWYKIKLGKKKTAWIYGKTVKVIPRP